jgi:hypothetical protein
VRTDASALATLRADVHGDLRADRFDAISLELR